MDLVPSACVVFVGAIAAFAATAEVQEPPRLKQAGERLVAGLPRPNPTAAELAVPCVNDRNIVSNDPRVLERLGRRRVYLLAFESWGMKWMPSHASLRRPAQGGGCNDYRFLIRQFQRAYGQPELPGWTVQDVERLVKAVEPVAQSLVSEGALPPELLEPIPGFSDASAFPVKEDK